MAWTVRRTNDPGATVAPPPGATGRAFSRDHPAIAVYAGIATTLPSRT